MDLYLQLPNHQLEKIRNLESFQHFMDMPNLWAQLILAQQVLMT
jgi:hypothetical protein